jgi:hypothetical protein
MKESTALGFKPQGPAHSVHQTVRDYLEQLIRTLRTELGIVRRLHSRKRHEGVDPDETPRKPDRTACAQLERLIRRPRPACARSGHAGQPGYLVGDIMDWFEERIFRRTMKESYERRRPRLGRSRMERTRGILAMASRTN